MKQCVPQNNNIEFIDSFSDFDSVSSHLTWVIFNKAKLYPFFLFPYLNFDVFSALQDKHLKMEIEY